MEHYREARTGKGESGRNALMGKYKAGAKSRDLVWNLTRGQFWDLTSGDCFYCGIQPQRTQIGSRGEAEDWGRYVYNGIDRMDNNMGYLPDNCVSCCTSCNLSKGTQSASEFISWIERVYTHQKSLG